MTIRQGQKFIIRVSIPDQLPRNVEVMDHIYAGLDPRCDLVLIDPRIKTKHFLFQKKENVLVVQLLAGDKSSYLNNVLMEKGKSYLIDAGDRLEVGKVTITIDSYIGDIPVQAPSRPLQFQSLEELKPEIQPVDQESERKPPPFVVHTPEKKPKPFLLHLKIQAAVLDFFFTYFFLTTFLPFLKVPTLMDNVVSLLTEIPFHFFVSFWLLRVLSTLIISKTFGEALLGLTTRKKTFIKKAASVVFVSFHDRVKQHFFFRFMRKMGFIFFIFLLLLSPFFLPLPYNAQVNLIKEISTEKMSLQTTSVQGYSGELGMTVKAEIDSHFMLLPEFTANKQKRVFVLTAAESKEAIRIEETSSLPYTELYKILFYANPFGRNINDKSSPKNLVLAALTFAPLNIGPVYQWLGPFWGSLFYLKKKLLAPLSSLEELEVHPFSESLPLIKIQSQGNELVLLFAKDKIVYFKVTHPLPYNHALNTVLYKGFLTQFYLDSTKDQGVHNSDVDLLMAQDQWKYGNSTALLTYFRNEVKKQSLSTIVNRDSGILLRESKKEILQSALTKMQKTIRDENLAKSLEDIKTLLHDKVNTNDRKSSGKYNVRKNPGSGQRTLQIQPRSRR